MSRETGQTGEVIRSRSTTADPRFYHFDTPLASRSLETGPLQPEAIGLYARAGYREIPCFGAYAAGQASRCFERRLA